jgi:hypothetical protein
MGWPSDTATITTLANDKSPGTVQKVELLGGASLQFTHDAEGLKVKMPAKQVGEHAFALKISGLKLS